MEIPSRKQIRTTLKALEESRGLTTYLTYCVRSLIPGLFPFLRSISLEVRDGRVRPRSRIETSTRTSAEILIPLASQKRHISFRLAAARAYFQAAGDRSRGRVAKLAASVASVLSLHVQALLGSGQAKRLEPQLSKIAATAIMADFVRKAFSCESSIRWMKERTEHFGVVHGSWTPAAMEAAMKQAQAPGREDVAPPRIPAEMRRAFGQTVERYRRDAKATLGGGVKILDRRVELKLDRDALHAGLLKFGILKVRRRRITQPV